MACLGNLKRPGIQLLTEYESQFEGQFPKLDIHSFYNTDIPTCPKFRSLDCEAADDSEPVLDKRIATLKN